MALLSVCHKAIAQCVKIALKNPYPFMNSKNQVKPRNQTKTKSRNLKHPKSQYSPIFKHCDYATNVNALNFSCIYFFIAFETEMGCLLCADTILISLVYSPAFLPSIMYSMNVLCISSQKYFLILPQLLYLLLLLSCMPKYPCNFSIPETFS